LLCLMVVCSSLACTPQPRLAGPTVPSGYFFAVQVSNSTITIPSGEVPRTSPTSAELIVRVQNTQGQPVDGIPVEFQVAPEGSASVSPQRALTNGGTARAIIQGQRVGTTQVRVRVEQTTQEAAVTVVDYDPD